MENIRISDSRAKAPDNEGRNALFDEYIKPEPRNLKGVVDNGKQEQGKESKPKTKPAEVVLSISEAGRIGSWQQQQYKKLGIETFKFSENRVGLELKAPVSKNALYLTLGMDTNVSFNFDKSNGNWILKNIKGLSVDKQPANKVEIVGKSITFYLNNGEKKIYGNAVQDYAKSLFDPLTRDDLRK